MPDNRLPVYLNTCSFTLFITLSDIQLFGKDVFPRQLAIYQSRSNIIPPVQSVFFSRLNIPQKELLGNQTQN